MPPGRRTVKTEPLPGSLVTVTSPPIMRRASPRHAHADIALEGDARLAAESLPRLAQNEECECTGSEARGG